MTKEELIKQLTAIAEKSHGDPEWGHAAADDLLLEFIDDKEVTEAFENVERWYA